MQNIYHQLRKSYIGLKMGRFYNHQRQQARTQSTIYQSRSRHKHQQCRHTITRQLSHNNLKRQNKTCRMIRKSRPTGPTTSLVPDENKILAQIANEESIPIADTLISNNSSIEATKKSTRTKTKRDFLQPKFHGKVYNVQNKLTHTSGKQWVFTNDKTKFMSIFKLHQYVHYITPF
jgi:hypothetical protein